MAGGCVLAPIGGVNVEGCGGGGIAFAADIEGVPCVGSVGACFEAVFFCFCIFFAAFVFLSVVYAGHL